MSARQADQREQLYAVDVSTLGLRQVKCMSLGTRSDGKKMKTLLFDDGSSLAVVASPLPKGARNLADCVDRNDPDHEELLKEHMLSQWTTGSKLGMSGMFLILLIGLC